MVHFHKFLIKSYMQKKPLLIINLVGNEHFHLKQGELKIGEMIIRLNST